MQGVEGIFYIFSYGWARHNAPRCTGFDALSLSLNKERAKENQPRGLIPLGTPEREKSFRCRSTHFFAKASIFSFCEHGLNKATLTEDARMRNSKRFCYLLRTPVQLLS
jgi:hypothetical protein